jgi:hypothetical protein
MTGPIKHPPSRILPFRAKVASSRVSTGRKLFADGGDGRSAWGRRWRDLILAHVADLGGMEVLSEAQISICRRASAMECELEAMEARLSEGETIDLGLYGRLAGRLCRMFELIGIQRLARPIDPTGDLAKALGAYARCGRSPLARFDRSPAGRDVDTSSVSQPRCAGS